MNYRVYFELTPITLFKSDFVRLGEHDISTTKDGKHEDIDIVGVEKHDQYLKNTGINDIAILYISNIQIINIPNI